jgi:membrane fusion protein (multidrug efflux system)
MVSRDRFIVFVLLACACVGMASAQGVATSGIERQEIRAQLRPLRYTTLSAEIGAVAKELPMREGQRFVKNDVILRLDCALLEAQNRKAVAEVAGAQRTLQANERLAELNAAGLMELDLARNAVEKAVAEQQIAQTQLSKCEIRAPFDGVIAEHRIREQQYVQPGTPVLDILDDSSYELEFLAPSSWLARMRANMVVKIFIDEARRAAFARVLRISPRIDPVSQSIKITAIVEGPTMDLKAGMSGRLQMP